jgi:hypothetical protein
MHLPTSVYHLTEEANWPAIQQHGLLPASSLFAASALTAHERSALECRQRPAHTVLPSGAHIRDQKPMPASALSSCLIGLTPAEWYALVNAHVFFWLDSERLNRQRAACGSRPQMVMVISTAELLASYGEVAFLTPFNTGYALRKPARRGLATFVAYQAWVTSGWDAEARALGTAPRKRAHPPAELLVRGGIPDFNRFIRAVIRLAAGTTFVPNAANP